MQRILEEVSLGTYKYMSKKTAKMLSKLNNIKYLHLDGDLMRINLSSKIVKWISFASQISREISSI